MQAPPTRRSATRQAQRRRKATLDQYMTTVVQSVQKQEYIDGEIRLMPYTSENHGLIVANLIGLLGTSLKGTGYRVYPNNRMLFVPETANYYYPDVMVVCGESVFKTYKGKMQATVNPTVLIEVLSESTSDYDETMKWYNYNKLHSLQQYIRVSQNALRLDLYTRVGDSNDWLNTFAEQPDQSVTIGGCTITIRDVYEHVGGYKYN
ncbi:Uma2 family endonuclease [Fibrella sp. HMF5335]|uniref:Uma2 family endonuclease n=1 Tax=Fibrella rubiginis TaxID=2817060 RepID=A0A939GB80_9BACT|nr:Uma2 family endonuclease [Fibrella rubiginis]MBO0935176.1 Uma2 family endonuclease [Fibrella rubiginis]